MTVNWRNRPRFVAVLCLAVVVLPIAGCGGGAIGKSDFVEKANAICEGASAKIRAEIARVASKESKASLAQTNALLMKKAVIPALKTELVEIDALGIPGEGTEQAEAFLSAQREAIAKAEVEPASFFRSQGGTLEAVELAGTRYGVTECPISAVEPE